MAAYRKVCSPFGIFPILGLGLAAIFLCLAEARSLAAGRQFPFGGIGGLQKIRPALTIFPCRLVSDYSSLNLLTGEIVIHESHPQPAGASQEARSKRNR